MLRRPRGTQQPQGSAIDEQIIAPYWNAHLGASVQTSTWVIARRIQQ